jgi:murein DD-endopeptidase MepM/ murein hydrolase activator NlpD
MIDAGASGQGGFESPAELLYTTGSAPDAALSDEETLLAEAESQDYQPLTYTVYRVKQGDMIEPLAAQFGITQDTLISVNNIKQTRLIQIDQYLKVPSMPGILYTTKSADETIETIAQKYEVSPEKCAGANNMTVGQALNAGAVIFVPGAELDWMTRQEINGDLFLWPLKSRYYISSRYAWRNSPFTGARSFHNGLDMAAPEGTNIYAAFDGMVSSVSYNNTYGNYIIITHRSGYQTLYGHMSRTIAAKGEYVWQNTVIGKVGSTGQSTGPHLHFTVFKNGKTMNPANLLP